MSSNAIDQPVGRAKDRKEEEELKGSFNLAVLRRGSQLGRT